MRSNGDGGERFLARVSASEGPDDMDEVDARERNRHDESIPHEPRPSAMPAAAAVKAPKGSKPRRSQAPKPIARTAPTDAAPKARADGGATAKGANGGATDKLSKNPPAKRAKAKPAAAPSVRSQRASVPAPRSSRPSRKPPAPKEAPAPISALAKSLPPPSLDPRTTLRDHSLQKSLASTVRASYPPGVAPPSRPVRPVREDEISIPPTTTHEAPADLDDHFFAQGEAAQAAAFQSAARIATARPDHVDALYEAAHRAVHVPPERRRKLTNYVKAAVGLSAVLCLAALVRVGVVHANSATERGVASSPVVTAVTAAPVVPPAPVVAETAPTPAAPPPAVVAEVPAASAAAPVDPASESTPPAEPVAPAKSAKQEKESARAALEHGKRKDAVEAAQRSVALDPTDAEAWLLLGSAQQDSGHWKEAHESFVSCTKQAKVGPLGECRMMLR